MKQYHKIITLFISSGFIFPHGVSESTANAMAHASLMNFVYFGAEHMVTGYDHILFLIGVLFFLTNYFDIFKFITAFTIAHCITLIFATLFEIRANAFLIEKAFSIISFCPAKSIPCLNFPTDPIIPDNLICGTIFFFLKILKIENM